MKHLIGIMLVGLLMCCNEAKSEAQPIDKNASIEQEIDKLYRQLDYHTNREDYSEEYLELRVQAINLISNEQERAKKLKDFSTELFEHVALMESLQYKIDSLEALVK